MQSVEMRASLLADTGTWARTANRGLADGTPLTNMIAGGSLVLWEWRLRLEEQRIEQKTAER